MSTTVRTASDVLLGYLRPEQRSYPAAATEDSPLQAVLDALNGALAEMAILSPMFQFTVRRGARVRAKTTAAVTGSWAAGDTSVTIASLESWMLGCSVQFPGSEPLNEITVVSGTTATLLNPLLNAGSGSITVWCNAVTVGTDVLQVLKPVSIADQFELAERRIHGITDSDYDRPGVERDYDWETGHTRGYPYMHNATPSLPDEAEYPYFYTVDKLWLGSATPAATRIRLSPMPTRAAILNYRARLQTPAYTTADLYGSGPGYADPNTYLPFEDAVVQAVFIPIAKMRFSGSPVFRNDEARPGIARDYAQAIRAASELSTANIGQSFIIKPRPW